MEKFLIIDGNSIINRAFYAIKMLTNKDGVYTNGIYGFLNILFKNLEELNPEYVAVAFDLRAPTFRHKMYSSYKAQRKGMPEELRMQMPILKEILSAMNIAIYEKEGYEADDIIGTVSAKCEEKGVECLILTGDKDDLQLASDKTKVMLTITKMGSTTTELYDDKKVFEKYGVTPSEFVDVKALMGDTSDNVPGVKGIGEKSAFSLIAKFKSIENLYKNLDDETIKPAARTKLAEGKDMADLSKVLCTIDKNVPMDISFDVAKKKEYNNERLSELFRNLEFSVFLKKISDGKTDEVKTQFKEIDLNEFREKLAKIQGEFVYKIYQSYGEMYSVAFLENDTVYAVVSGLENPSYAIADAVKKVFEDKSIYKISSDIKEDIVLLNSYGIDYVGDYFDISIGGYIINPSHSDYEISHMASEYLSRTILSEDELLGTGKSRKDISEVEYARQTEYINAQVSSVYDIFNHQKKEIEKNGQENLLYDIELPLVRVLASMEIEGFTVDKESLKAFNEMLSDRISELEKSIYALAGEEFNINSPKQLGVILFEKLGLYGAKKTKTGYSTNADVLEKLRYDHPIVESVIEYRQLAKLKSTYGDGLLAVIDSSDGKIHSKFNQTVTVTGRISSTEPNLQNIPVRTELGRELRKMFVSKGEDYVLVDADYSQIELRILAHVANDESMINAFKTGEDIHSSTAKKVFGVTDEEMTPLLRSRAKAVNFGIVYGQSDFGLSQELKITKKEAKDYIESYFEKYSNVKKYLDETIEKAKADGYVTTLFGRRRYVPELNSSNFIQRSFGERVAMNTPIQGTAADVIKIAMVKVYNALLKNNLKSKLILQVHDELIIETHKDEVDIVKELLCECMADAASLSVPLDTEANVGKTWYDAK